MSKAVESREAMKAFKAPRGFIKEVVQELRKVKWPSSSDVKQLTGVVLVTLFIVTIYVAALETVIGWAFRQLHIFRAG